VEAVQLELVGLPLSCSSDEDADEKTLEELMQLHTTLQNASCDFKHRPEHVPQLRAWGKHASRHFPFLVTFRFVRCPLWLQQLFIHWCKDVLVYAKLGYILSVG